MLWPQDDSVLESNEFHQNTEGLNFQSLQKQVALDSKWVSCYPLVPSELRAVEEVHAPGK